MANFLDLLFGKKKVAQRSKPKTEQPSPDPTDASQIIIANTPEGFVQSSEKLLLEQKAEQEEKERPDDG